VQSPSGEKKTPAFRQGFFRNVDQRVFEGQSELPLGAASSGLRGNPSKLRVAVDVQHRITRLRMIQEVGGIDTNLKRLRFG
jgi:hypothetical protein